MRRKNAVEVVVAGPDKGLYTSAPSSKINDRSLTVARNVRADYGVLRTAPGYERVLLDPKNLDSPANLIFQSNILNNDPEIQTTPIIGTQSKVYTIMRRARELVCTAGAHSCPLTVAFFGDAGRVGPNLSAVADLIKGWSPDLIVHAGDIVYNLGGESDALNDHEEVIGQYFAGYVGGYNGVYGVGPVENRFFPVLGNHDWTDAPVADYFDFFQLPGNERYYSYKRGPIHFIHMSSHQPEEPDGITEGSIQGQWARAQIEDSDCPWRIVVLHHPPRTSDINHNPGETDLEWLFSVPGLSAIVAGHAHNAEIVQVGSVYQFITGNGGHSLRGFGPISVNGSLWRYSSDYGALRLDATRTQLTWSYYRKDGTLLKTVTQSDPQESSGVCYISDAAKAVFTLRIVPTNAAVEVGFQWPFEAIAEYEDGSVENVTLESIWSTSDGTIASVVTQSGLSTGVAPGTVVVTAEFRGQTATANLTVLHSCLDQAMEVMYIVQRSESMNSTANGASRLQHVKEGLELSVRGFSDERDALALVSFNDTATTDQVLTSEFTDLLDRAAALAANGEATGLGQAFAAALTELTSVRHSSSRRRAVVLVVDGSVEITGAEPPVERDETSLWLKSTDGLYYPVALENTGEGVIVPEADDTEGTSMSSMEYMPILGSDGQIWRWSLETSGGLVSHLLSVSPDQSEDHLTDVDLKFGSTWYEVTLVVESGIPHFEVDTGGTVWPVAVADADALKDAGIRVVVYGYGIHDATKRTQLEEIASDGFAFFIHDPAELKLDLALLANMFCLVDQEYYYDYEIPPTPVLYSTSLNYYDFLNWDVIRGAVDLIGTGTNGVSIYDIQPGNGMYVDLVGSQPGKYATAPGQTTTAGPTIDGSWYGKIRSKETFSFVTGKTYKLSFYAAGRNIPNSPLSTPGMYAFDVSIENALPAETVEIDDQWQPFTLYSYEFTVGSNTAGRIIFDHTNTNSNVGLLLDRVSLENVTDSVTMFSDDFDDENPAE
jgi:tartrate-resistant acid phosphatase type 5